MDKCFSEVIAEVCGMLAEIVGPRCRHGIYVALGNAHKSWQINGPKVGLLGV